MYTQCGPSPIILKWNVLPAIHLLLENSLILEKKASNLSTASELLLQQVTVILLSTLQPSVKTNLTASLWLRGKKYSIHLYQVIPEVKDDGYT